MSPTILLLGTFDTKGQEYAYVRSLLLEMGCRVLTMDLGILGSGGALFPVDIDGATVARAGGTPLEALRARRDRGDAVLVMQQGAEQLARELYLGGRFTGIMGMGGGGGTSMIAAAMRGLPVGVPKLLVSTMASGNTAPYVDVKDLTLMYSVVDIAGLNPLSRRILRNAASAMAGMVSAPQDGWAAPLRPLVAATMFGVTTPCVTRARARLEDAGYDVVVFHATGTGGRAMEGLIEDGYFAAVLDITTTEWCDEVVGGVLTAGPDRLGAAARRGIPQVVSVGALDMVNFGAADTVPERFRERTLYRHNPSVTLMRTTPGECAEIGRRIGEKLAQATGPVTLLLPLRGVSMLDAEGQPFHDTAADRALFDALRRHAGSKVTIRALDLHLNDDGFADALADAMLDLLRS